jgi:hypothetical protein
MENIYQIEDIEIHSFDFTDLDLITKSIELLNSNSTHERHNLAYWRWRFDSNPFAENYGWYAKEIKSGELAAILLFWPWKYNYNKKEYLFYQAIDGITNQKYRNKGIFMHINKIALSYFNENNHALFGIPNGKSYPTYKKLNWKTIEKIDPYIVPLTPVKSTFRLFFGTSSKSEMSLQDYKVKPFDIKNEDHTKIKTHWTRELIDWRFVKHPLFNYYAFHSSNCDIIFKLKVRGKMTEAQILFSNIMEATSFKKFKKFLIKHQFDLISYYGSNTVLDQIIKKTILKVRKKKTLFLVLKDIPELRGVPFTIEQAERDTT